jgi:hypothetical protein
MIADIPNKQGMGSFILLGTGSLQTLLRLALVSNKVLHVDLVPGEWQARDSKANIGINLHLLVVLGYDESNHYYVIFTF